MKQFSKNDLPFLIVLLISFNNLLSNRKPFCLNRNTMHNSGDIIVLFSKNKGIKSVSINIPNSSLNKYK